MLDKYADEGLGPLEDAQALRVPPLSMMDTPMELMKRFGCKDAYVNRLSREDLHRQAAGSGAKRRYGDTG